MLRTSRYTIADARKEIVGIDQEVPVLDGSKRRYVFLDNGASTPAFRGVLDAVNEFLPWYSGVHRGTGFKSLVATDAFDAAHDLIARFVGADPDLAAVIFTKNTTEAVNKLSNRFRFAPDDVVITTLMEHHSNDLPWRKNARVVHVGIMPDGSLDLAALREAITRERGRLRLVAVTGASNITGVCPPIHDIAALAHDAGAKIFVDAAQLTPHRRINMLPPDHRGHIDFLAFSAHKMYAPFGTGVLIGPREFFSNGDPDQVGGGVVDVVTLDRAVWNQPPHKEEAGSPNVIGGIALAASIAILEEIGLESIADHEHELLEYAYPKLRAVDGVTLYGPRKDLRNKVGVITFNMEGIHHSLVAAILGTEGGLGVRDGCFCAHPYVKELLHVTAEEDRTLTEEVLAGDKSRMPGMVRASLGCYNSKEDVDILVDMLTRVSKGAYAGRYVQDRATGAFHAEGFSVDMGSYYPLAGGRRGPALAAEAS
jgi:cysteine desulfurase/selenocysteine lyase